MPIVRNEGQLQLALQAMERDKKLTSFAAAKLYGVSRTTLNQRRKGVCPRAETIANSRNLDPLEEEVIIRRVLNLYNQGFSPGLNIIENITNLFCKTYSALYIGLC